MGIQEKVQRLREQLRKGLPVAQEPAPQPIITRDELDKIQSRLQRATEDLNRVILKAERVFDDLGLHKEASIPLKDHRTSPVRQKAKQQALVWLKLDGRWQMGVETRQTAKGGGTYTTVAPILSTSRQTRTEALGIIKEFHAALVMASKVA